MTQQGTAIEKVSVHGGHSGQFCHHAKDALEDVVRAYVDRGYTWVGITEHMAPLSDALRYPDESRDNLSAGFLLERFHRYFDECRVLQEKYRDRITLYTAFETETYEGSTPFVKQLVAQLRPDYLVGSVHHVNGICIDYDAANFQAAVKSANGLVNLYLAYFDAQFAMLQELKPAVVGHFDLVRKFDVDYRMTLENKSIRERIRRNLAFVAEQDLIIDFNLRGFDKAVEQYPCTPVLEQALALGIAVVPGDDSHGVSSIGRNYERGVQLLASLGASTRWQKPALIRY